ncbi:MAG: DNA mismatch repair endonuclease MutL [Candidatus Abyssobacteria bacterium SURF_17]|uniref:DNA mismatch repair protein MutL n=1 Tax=Candidatus Abyssobacteria bacterium SURF_17 TaxID=2093361 RepID=A0A419EV34_9BACT|nr:MAG: DNA mismatch repair endonuclease MutL [Candidatus Abyssubacteria bacterium SURF_17]
MLEIQLHNTAVAPMPTINILTEDTANKIAAGEVIERPSSVVKELVENAIDAGARKLSLELEAGGKRLARVSDDGCGMSYEDALLCLERHATSKISNASDLDAIATFGFRGEAIPSIAAVSEMEIITRARDRLSGTRVVVEGGVIRDVSETGAPVGTQMTVRRLFFNTPARRKFMKAAATELGHVTNMVQRQALAHPHINFRLVSGGRETLNLPPAGSIRDRIALIWGNEFVRELSDGVHRSDGLTVSGYFGTPALTRSNRDHQFFFLNRRPIVNRLLGKALADAYRGVVMSDRFPVAFIFIEIRPHMVDVNIHPTKREVRFANPNIVLDALREAARAALKSTRPARNVASAALRTQSDAGAGAQHAEPLQNPNGKPGTGAVFSGNSLFQTIRVDEVSIEAVLPMLEEEEQRRPRHPSAVMWPTADFSAVSPDIRLIRQVFNSYLLCTDADGLIIVDQHALHERVLYDELVRKSDRTHPTTQQMLIPITIEFSPDRAEVLSAHLGLFSQIGIEIEPFGPRTFAVTALARVHSENRVDEIVREGVDELYLGLRLKAPREILRRLMTISACKNSIKAGDPLSDREAEMLVEKLKELPRPPTCLHGRPLVLRLTEAQIARAFGRKG